MLRKLVVAALITVSALASAGPAGAHASRYPLSVWQALSNCEAGGNWHDQRGGYEGGVHFAPSTWRKATRLAAAHHPGRRYPAHAYQATGGVQIEVAEVWLAHTSWGQWPVCSRKIGVR